jgi:hypothetical protein
MHRVARFSYQCSIVGYFCPNPPKGKIRVLMRTNRTTTTDFALSSADTKLSRFDSSFSSGIPFPDGVCFAFPALSKTLHPITAWGRERAFCSRRHFPVTPTRSAVEHYEREVWECSIKPFHELNAVYSSRRIGIFTFLGVWAKIAKVTA